MEMMKVNAGKLRAIGYDSKTRTLRVEMDDGSTLEHANVGESLWRNLKNAGAQWSYYRDNIQEEFTARRVSDQKSQGTGVNPQDTGVNPLDALFK